VNTEKTFACISELFGSLMSSSLDIVESLSRAEQLRLMSELAEYLRAQAASESSVSILKLQGLGKEIWQGIDAQEYVDRERAAWNG
jgi:hypothetical protein